MVGVLDVVGADLQPAFGELHRVFQLGGAADGASPDGAHRAAHFDAGIMAFLNTALGLIPIVGQGGARVGKVVFFFGGNHHQDTVRPDSLLAQGDGAVYARLTDG